MFDRTGPHLFDRSLIRVGVEIAKKPYLSRMNGRIMDVSALGYVSEGTGWFESKEHGRQPVVPGTLLLQPADVWHCHDPDATWTEYWLVYRAEGLRHLFGAIVPSAIGARTIGLRRDCLDLWQELYAAWPAFGPGSLERACLLAHRLFFAIDAALQRRDDPKTIAWLGEADSRIRAVVRARAFDPEQLARTLKVPYHTFRREFSRQMGVAPKQYWLRLRMERAIECLTNTGMSVGETAHYLGFDDPAYFTRMFTRIMGAAPGRYRHRV